MMYAAEAGRLEVLTLFYLLCEESLLYSSLGNFFYLLYVVSFLSSTIWGVSFIFYM